jgi:vacuolar-type H+-ATPase subunit E/Vma4
MSNDQTSSPTGDPKIRVSRITEYLEKVEEKKKDPEYLLKTEIQEQSASDEQAIIREAEQAAEKTLRDAKAEAEKIQTEILKKAAGQADAVRKRILSGVHLEVKKQHLQVIEETLAKIFQQVVDKLNAFRKDNAYGEFLERLTLEGVEALDSAEIQIIPGEIERPLMTGNRLTGIEKEAEKRKRKVRLTLSGQTLGEGGVVMVSADGRTRFDNSFSARIRRYQSVLRMTAMKLLG